MTPGLTSSEGLYEYQGTLQHFFKVLKMTKLIGILSGEVQKCFSRCVDPMVHSLKLRVRASGVQVRETDATTILDSVYTNIESLPVPAEMDTPF